MFWQTVKPFYSEKTKSREKILRLKTKKMVSGDSLKSKK